MLSRILIAVLNGVITFIVLSIIVAVLGMVGAGSIGAVIAPFIWVISVLVGVLTFLGMIPNYWPNLIK